MDQIKGLSFGAALSYHMQGRRIRRKGRVHMILTRWAIALLGMDRDDWEVV